MQERRLAPRIEFSPHVMVSITCMYPDGRMDVQSACMTDASLEGVRLVTSKSLDPDTEVIICTLFPDMKRNLILEGSIVRKETDEKNSEHVCGVRLYMSEEETVQLLDFLDEVRLGKTYAPCRKHSEGRYTGPNRREYFRIAFDPHARGILRSMHGSPGVADVCLMDFSAIGARFRTNLDIPEHSTGPYVLEAMLGGESLRAVGQIIRKVPEGKRFVYAMKFAVTEEDISRHVAVVNRLVASKRNGNFRKLYVPCGCA